MNMYLLVFLMMVVTFSARLIPALFIDHMKFSPKMYQFLKLIPFTAMTALVFPGILTTDSNNIYIGIVGGVVALVAAYKKVPTILIVLLSVVAVYIAYII